MSKQTYGALLSPKDLRNYKLNSVAKAVALPTTFNLGTVTIKNQGAVCSCVAHTLAEILEKMIHVRCSTAWIYGYRPSGYYQDLGMVPLDALKTVQKVGYLYYTELRGNIEMQAAKDKVNSNLTEYKKLANNKKVISYAKLNGVQDIKQAIYSSLTPVFISIGIDKNTGLLLDKNYIAYIPDEIGTNHAVMCYGWNEKGLLIQNSWGSTWGNKGTFILPYEYGIQEAWFVNVNNQDLIQKPSAFTLRELIMNLFHCVSKSFKK